MGVVAPREKKKGMLLNMEFRIDVRYVCIDIQSIWGMLN